MRVHFQVVEGTRRRTQVFEGVVLKQKGGGSRRTFTVRKLSFGVGVERTFPVHSPKIERIEVVGRGEVRRAKLYYLRGRVGRAARLREMRDFRPEEVGMIGRLRSRTPPDGAADGAEEVEPQAPRRSAEEAAPRSPTAADESRPRRPQPASRGGAGRRRSRRPRSRTAAAEPADEGEQQPA